MTSLSKEQVQRYQQIYEEHYGKKITETEAYRQGYALVTLISNILKNINIEKSEGKNGSIQKNKN